MKLIAGEALMKLNACVPMLLLSAAIAGCAADAKVDVAQTAPKPAAQPAKAASVDHPTNADAALLKDFKDRVDLYMKVYEKQETGSAQPRETSDPGKIKATQDVLAARIQAARSTAKHGDVFTPEIRQLFRRLMYPETKGPDAKETKQTIKEDAPSPAAVSKMLKVNARFPEGQPLPTVPPNLLARLPQLPKELEYRILNKDLILRDVNANLIVDFIPNAIQ